MISYFSKSKTQLPSDKLELDEWLHDIKTGKWKKPIEALRQKKDKAFNIAKNNLPCVTVSGTFKTRDVATALQEKLIKHSGFICIDVDKKDNPKMRAVDLVDKDCYAQFISCSGEGKKIIYRCPPVSTAEEHRRIYDAVIKRLHDKGIKLKADPIVKSIMSLQYVSYDPQLHYHPKTKLVIKPLPPIKVSQRLQPSIKNIDEEIKQLSDYIDNLGDKDITKSYEDWMIVMFGLSYSFGEKGRDLMHRLCSNYENYSAAECDEKYDACLERRQEDVVNPVTLASVYQLINDALPKVTLKHLAKKFNKSHAVGIGEDVDESKQGDLHGLVRYKLFLFKKIFDKETNTLLELVPTALNLNEFESLLRSKGFYRYEDMLIHIVDNIVDTVDIPDILRIVTEHIEKEGDYRFTYKKIEFGFSWEELIHLWRMIRANGTTANQIMASLQHWKPNLLQDTQDTSYIPYQNGVVKVTANDIELLPYNKLRCEDCKLRELCGSSKPQCGRLNKQIWRERILPREFKLTTKKGMFEDFFVNVTGYGKTAKDKKSSTGYKRALWYYGYMLQGTKRQSTARAWILYDKMAGNNGRTGKTILGQAIGKIRSVTVIDGKQVDFRNRFAFQTVSPWTDVVFIDDPSKYMSLIPLFNMISGTLVADKKGVAPIERPVKFMIASNWILEAEGSSEIGRQFVSQLDDFYVRYSKENGNTITPIVHLHGKEFFTDWDDQDWAEFDTFSLKALQYHLGTPAPENTIIGNALQTRFIQTHEVELFHELVMELIKTAKYNKQQHCSYVPQAALCQVIKDSGGDAGRVKAGRVARDFLLAIGATNIQVSSMVVGGGVTRMAYKFEGDFNQLPAISGSEN